MEDRYSRVQEWDSDQEEDYRISENRSLMSDRLYFADEHDVLRYQVHDSDDDSTSEEDYDYEAEVVAQTAMERIQKAKDRGKPHVRLTHEELEALSLSRPRRASPQLPPSPPVEYIRQRVSPPIDASRRRSHFVEAPIEQNQQRVSPSIASSRRRSYLADASIGLNHDRISPPLDNLRRRSRLPEAPVKETIRRASPPRSIKRRDKDGQRERQQAWTRQRSQPRYFSATLAGPTRQNSTKSSSGSSSRHRSSRLEGSPIKEIPDVALTRHKSHGDRAKRDSQRVSSWPTSDAHMEY